MERRRSTTLLSSPLPSSGFLGTSRLLYPHPMARIELRKRGPIGEIRLNRPEVLNALGHQWPEDMLAAAREMQEDRAIRVVLVTGEGRTFCSGLDLTQLARGEIPNR